MLLASIGSQVHAISTVMNHRLVASSPLLYKVMVYSQKELSIEFEPWVSGAFDPAHTMANLTPNGTSSLSLDQQGNGDINPEWILLAASDNIANYQSVINLDPKLSMNGLLFHCYKQFEHLYFDVKTALIECSTEINITEIGGGDGILSPSFPDINNHMNDEIIYTAQDAFTQAEWEYGKIGKSNKVIGFDNIQVTLGSTATMNSFASAGTKSFFSGFVLFEVPTGAGSKAEWLFEPQVGTNHWAFGFGADVLVLSDNQFQLVAGGNYRHFIAGWEKRSFDLTENGPWSRYLGIDFTNPPAGTTPNIGRPGINIFTQDALIEGRDQVTMYARLQKRFQACLFELSYNYMHNQAETISQVTALPQGYGIFDMNAKLGGAGITCSAATISEYLPVQDTPNPIMLVTSNLDFTSGAASAWSGSTIAARLQRVQENYSYGIGSSVDIAHSAQALSSWSVWANFEILL